MSPSPKLLSPKQVGNLPLAHRVVLAPLTRYRADGNHVHTDMGVEYYRQRASIPGTLMISEATVIAPQAGGYNNVPGIWNDAQMASWKKITDAVHDEGSFIFVQLWALGRAARPANLEETGHPYVSSSAIPLAAREGTPQELTIAEIQEYMELYATAAEKSIQAGFDGVELHGANGYLPDQFLQDVCNTRTDQYGGPIENRARFFLEVVNAIARKIGASRLGVRISPWSTFQGMGMLDPIPTFAYLITKLRERHPDLAFLHAIQPRIIGNDDTYTDEPWTSTVRPSNQFIRELWAPRPLILAGGFSASTALAAAEEHDDLVAFGRYYISNPDLPKRIQLGLPFAPYDRTVFYTPGTPTGYTDYPMATVPRSIHAGH